MCQVLHFLRQTMIHVLNEPNIEEYLTLDKLRSYQVASIYSIVYQWSFINVFVTRMKCYIIPDMFRIELDLTVIENFTRSLDSRSSTTCIYFHCLSDEMRHFYTIFSLIN